MSRRWWFALTTALLTLIAIAALGEIVARALGRTPWRAALSDEPWSTPHPELGWINREGTSAANEAGRAPMTFWSGGRRSSRPSEAAPPRASRQAALVGGSWFQGYGVRDPETFAWKAGEQLPHWQFENFGTGGYGTLQASLSAEIAVREGRIAPDLIVYGFATFHGMRNVQTFDWVDGLRDRSGQRLVPPRAAFESGRVVRRAPSPGMPDWPLERHSALVRSLHQSAARFALAERDRWVAPITRRLIRDLDATSRASGARFLVMSVFGEGDLEPYQEHLRRHGIAQLDCRYPGDVWAPELRVGGTGHPNEVVHAHWARCLTDWIEREFEPAGG